MDQMFADPNGPLIPGFQGIVARSVLETPEGRSRYLACMDEFLKKNYSSAALVKRLDELQARVQPALTAVDAGAGRGYAGQVQRLRDAVKQREKSLTDQLQRTKK
jgi:hypothetical protein